MKLKSFLGIISMLLILALLLLTIFNRSVGSLKKDNFIPRASINNSFEV